MCGIVGIANWSGEPADSELLWRMIRTIRHRGPDADGVYVDGPVGLAHARLSIIDIAGGQQPMCNADRTLCITFNGEIFNYLELRQDLEARGHRFVTKSDTEVILRAYEEKGERCVDDFNGQWAFAIWDSAKRLLFLSRDRIGVRPLFYTSVGQSFLFGSEIKSLFQHRGVTRRLDPQGLDQTFTFWAPLAPRTSFAEVFELPPGNSMTVTASSMRVAPYWQLEYPQDDRNRTDQQYADELRELLHDATRIRLRSDVPVGAYLSGGLDSAVVTSLIRRCSDAPLKTFSITFDDAEFDESGYQQEAVRFLGTDHHDLRCSPEDIGRVFPEVVRHAEKPLLRTAPAPMFLLAELVRKHGYKVVLTGEGADEILGGYDVFKEAKIRRFWASQPESQWRPLLLKRLYPYLPQLHSQSPEYLKAFFSVRSEDRDNPFFSHIPRWNLTARLKTFLSRDIKAQLADYDSYAQIRSTLPACYGRWDGFSQAQYLETAGLLPGYILSSQGDRVAMAHAVEGRYPFLDHRVVAFASRLPSRLKMKALQEKYLLKRSSDGLVPAVIRQRKKQPYRAPEATSFCGTTQDPIRHAYVDELLSPGRLQEDGVFAPEAVQQLVQKVRSGRAVGIADNMALVGILSTQLLVQQFVRHSGN
jgi:asparagine synthase (glutamine-hydrolysing)